MNTATMKKVEQDGFELKLPDIFDLKPAYEIDLPAKRKALLYDTTQYVRDYSLGDNKFTSKPGWRVVVVTRHGRVVNPHMHRNNDATVFTEPLSMFLYIKGLVQEYTKTKKTTVEDTELDD